MGLLKLPFYSAKEDALVFTQAQLSHKKNSIDIVAIYFYLIGQGVLVNLPVKNDKIQIKFLLNDETKPCSLDKIKVRPAYFYIEELLSEFCFFMNAKEQIDKLSDNKNAARLSEIFGEHTKYQNAYLGEIKIKEAVPQKSSNKPNKHNLYKRGPDYGGVASSAKVEKPKEQTPSCWSCLGFNN